MPTKLYCVMGATNAGKSTFLKYMQNFNPNLVGLVEVGKALREKYGEKYFNGEAAPEKTVAEAWDIMVSAIAKHIADGKDCVFVDGQPRNIEQTSAIMRLYCENDNYECAFINLYAPEYIRRMRAMKRDADDSEKLSLSLSRMTGDLPRLYDVISILLNNGQQVLTFDTSLPSYSLQDLAEEFVGN